MIPPIEAPSESRNALPVLLVILGGLGDWSIRRVLQQAAEFETASNGEVVTLVIDVHPTNSARDTYEQWMNSADRWIVRRLIEQTAEEVDQPWRDAADAGREGDWGFTGRLTINPMLPDPTTPDAGDPNDAITTFIDLLGGIFRAAYEGNNVALASSIGLQMKPYLDDVELQFNQNPAKTSELLRRRWPIKSNSSTFEHIRADIINYVASRVSKIADTSKVRLNLDRNRLNEYLGGYVSVGGTQVYRYWRSEPDSNKILHFPTNGNKLLMEQAMLANLAQEHRIIVYAATPPNTYPELLQRWSSYAERIAFEKPIAGLLDKSDQGELRLTQAANPTGVETTKRIRKAVADALRNPNRLESLPTLSVSSVDHYNSKWTVAAIEWLKRRKIVDHILKEPRRISIQVMEGGLLPRGRFQFYNGVGGALADMLSHLIQPLRAVSGYLTIGELLSELRVVDIKRARYDLNEDYLLPAIGTGFASQKDLAEKLAKDTETFGVVHLRFKEGRWKDKTDVFIRTGKGFLPQSKTMVIEARDEDGPVALICDIDRKRISLADNGWPPMEKYPNDLPAREWMVTREFDVPGLMRDHRFTLDTKEYFAVFSALCSPEDLDARFFPSLEDASQTCDFFYEALIKHRLASLGGLEGPNVYSAYDHGDNVRSWLAAEAGWYQLGR